MIDIKRSLCGLFCSHPSNFSVRSQILGESVILLAFWPSSGFLAFFWLSGLLLAFWPSSGFLAFFWLSGLHLAFWPSSGFLAFIWLSGLLLARSLLSSLDYLFVPAPCEWIYGFFRLCSHVWILCVLSSRSLFCLVGLAPFLLETIRLPHTLCSLFVPATIVLFGVCSFYSCLTSLGHFWPFVSCRRLWSFSCNRRGASEVVVLSLACVGCSIACGLCHQ